MFKKRVKFHLVKQMKQVEELILCHYIRYEVMLTARVCVCVLAGWPSGQHSLLSLSSCSFVLSRVDNTQTRARVCMFVNVCVFPFRQYKEPILPL